MSFVTQGKTNLKYILIVVVLAVIVGGGILWLVTEKETPFTQLPEIKKEEDATASWKTYRSEEYGFELRYPESWNTYPDWSSEKYDFYLESGGVVLSPYEKLETEKGSFVVKVYKSSSVNTDYGVVNPSDLTLKEIVEKTREVEQSFYSRVETETSEVTLNNIPAIKEENKKIIGENFPEAIGTDFPESEMTIYYLDREGDNRKFVIGYGYLVTEKGKHQKIFSQILSTFKFFEKCAKEGESRCGPIGCIPCCPGLKSHFSDGPELAKTEENEVICLGAASSICIVECGDGICGKGENWCVCPKDCEKPNPEEVELSSPF